MTETPCSRRLVLRAGLTAGGLLVVAPAALAGCSVLTPDVPEGPDPLEAPARRAEADAALARALADSYPELAGAATSFATDRQAHAAALRTELRRVHPEPTPTGSTTPPQQPPVVPEQTGARNALANAISGAQSEAAGLVPTLPGYRAALLASVAACCASHAVVLT